MNTLGSTAGGQRILAAASTIRFTTFGLIALVLVILALAANDKVGRIVVFGMLALILLVILINYKNFLQLFFTGTGV